LSRRFSVRFAAMLFERLRSRAYTLSIAGKFNIINQLQTQIIS